MLDARYSQDEVAGEALTCDTESSSAERRKKLGNLIEQLCRQSVEVTLPQVVDDSLPCLHSDTLLSSKKDRIKERHDWTSTRLEKWQ